MKRKMLAVLVFFSVFLFNSCLPIPTQSPHRTQSFTYNDKFEEAKDSLGIVRCMSPETMLILTFAKVTGMPLPKAILEKLKVKRGTGFIVDSHGYMVTNAHVVDEGWFCMASIQEEEYEIEQIERDVPQDIALLKLKDVPGLLKPVVFAREPVKTGDMVFTIGRSFLDMSFKTGVVSHPARKIKPNVTNMQMTLPVNPGESGSPVFNMQGQVVGVVKAFIPKLNSVSLAVPGKVVEKSVYTLRIKMCKNKKKATK